MIQGNGESSIETIVSTMQSYTEKLGKELCSVNQNKWNVLEFLNQGNVPGGRQLKF